MTRHVSEYAACRVPLRRVTFGDAVLVVHEGAMDSIKRIEARWLAAGGNDAYEVRKGDTGAYNCRKTTSGRSWSKHSWGCAADINWQTNPYRADGRLITDMPAWFVQLWLEEGWGWGGNWHKPKDAMHFSKFPNEGGDGLLYVESKEEDRMNEEQEAILKDVRSAVFAREGGQDIPIDRYVKNAKQEILTHVDAKIDALREEILAAIATVK